MLSPSIVLNDSHFEQLLIVFIEKTSGWHEDWGLYNDDNGQKMYY